MRWEDLQYHILPGRHEPYLLASTTLMDQSFVFWQNAWNKILEDNKTTSKINDDDFLRQAYIAVFTYQDEIIGMHCYSKFDLLRQATRQHSYFKKFYPPQFWQILDCRKTRHILTMEYLTIAPAWRGKRLGPPLGLVMASLGCKIALDVGTDAILSVARSDVGATSYMEQMGGTVLIGNLDIYNTPCDIMAIYQEATTIPTTSGISEAVAYYWDHKDDHAGLGHLEQQRSA